MDEEIKDCPFCAGKAERLEDDDYWNYIACEDCMAESPRYKIKATALKAWNTRT